VELSGGEVYNVGFVHGMEVGGGWKNGE